MNSLQISLPSRSGDGLAQPSVEGITRAAETKVAPALAHGLSILGAFRASDAALLQGELSRRTGLAPAVTRRLCLSLVELGYLQRMPDGRYSLSDRVLTLAYPLLASTRIRERARPLMNELARDVKGIVSLVRADRADAIYLEIACAVPTPSFRPDVGFSTPLVATAHGRALLSLMDDTARAALLDGVALETPELWAANQARVSAAMAQCRERGFCVSFGDWSPDTYAVAAPVGLSCDGRLLALNCGIPAYRIDRALLESDIGIRVAALARVLRDMQTEDGDIK